jgi:hypothetical protein
MEATATAPEATIVESSRLLPDLIPAVSNPEPVAVINAPVKSDIRYTPTRITTTSGNAVREPASKSTIVTMAIPTKGMPIRIKIILRAMIPKNPVPVPFKVCSIFLSPQ